MKKFCFAVGMEWVNHLPILELPKAKGQLITFLNPWSFITFDRLMPINVIFLNLKSIKYLVHFEANVRIMLSKVGKLARISPLIAELGTSGIFFIFSLIKNDFFALLSS